MKRRQLLRFGSSAFLATSLGLLSQPASAAFTDKSVILWNRALLQAVRTNRVGPSVTARALAMLHTAIYDAWAAYDRVASCVYLEKRYKRHSSQDVSLQQQQALSY